MKDISKARVSLVGKLKQKKHRDANNLFVTEGLKCTGDTAKLISPQFVVIDKNSLEEYKVRQFIDEIGFDGSDIIVCASSSDMKKMSCLSTPSAVIGIFRQPDSDLDENLIKTGLTLMLDGIQDPGNLGTIVRIADWFGIRQIICSPDTVDVYNAKAIMSTMGSLARVKVFYRSLPEFCEKYPDIPVCGLLLDGKNMYGEIVPGNAFIVMGSEGHGLSGRMRSLVTKSLLIPSYPPGETHGESLNVAVATAITLSYFRFGK